MVAAAFVLIVGELLEQTLLVRQESRDIARPGPGGPSSLVAAAFLLILMGLLIKSAIVPFHFWLAAWCRCLRRDPRQPANMDGEFSVSGQ